MIQSYRIRRFHATGVQNIVDMQNVTLTHPCTHHIYPSVSITLTTCAIEANVTASSKVYPSEAVGHTAKDLELSVSRFRHLVRSAFQMCADMRFHAAMSILSEIKRRKVQPQRIASSVTP